MRKFISYQRGDDTISI